MEKIHIKVSRDASKKMKSLSKDLKELIGAALNAAVRNHYLDWEDVALLSGDELLEFVREWETDSHGTPSMEELEKRAERFAWSAGYYGYKLQSRF